MRYAILGDVHSNLEALGAVLTDSKIQHIDKFLCIGDVVGYGANPCECISLIKDLNPLLVAGNHDWASVELFDISYFNMYAREAVIWTKNVLDEEEKLYLASLKLTDQNADFTLFHGTLIMPQNFDYILNPYAALGSLAALNTKIGFFGHTHMPGVFILSKEDSLPDYSYKEEMKLSPSKKYLVNVGSVGQPRDSDPRACYCLYDTDEETIAFRRIEYDIPKAQEKIIKAGLPIILAERLSEGR